jgi:hypothetical protein
LKGRHLELQDAHAEMSRYLQKCEKEAARVGKCRATIEMQEGVISRLEGLLEQAAVDQRRLAEAEALASRVQDANSVLQSGPDWEELSILRDTVSDLRVAYRERESDHKDLTNERISLTLRVEKSEANAIASNNEMLEVSRRCAREIAGLRSKLAEKDAQLMGGFGSVANMILSEMGGPPRLSTMEPPPIRYAPESRPQSAYRMGGNRQKPDGGDDDDDDDGGYRGKRGDVHDGYRGKPDDDERETHAEKENDAQHVTSVSGSDGKGSSLETGSRPQSRRGTGAGASRPDSGAVQGANGQNGAGASEKETPASGPQSRHAPAGADEFGSRPSTGGTSPGSRPGTGTDGRAK